MASGHLHGRCPIPIPGRTGAVGAQPVAAGPAPHSHPSPTLRAASAARFRRRVGRCWLRSLLALVALPLGGCSVELRMAEVEDPSQATTTITYTSLREQARRFPDYGGIDPSILSPAEAKTP